MSPTWLGATLRLLEGHHTASVWAWEESGMTLIRRGEWVEMFDVHHSGHIVCPRVSFPLRDFALALADAAEAAHTLFEAVMAASPEDEKGETIRNNLGQDWLGQIAALREAAGRPLPPPPESARLPPPAGLIAIRLNDRPALERAIAEHGPDQRHDGEPLLDAAINYRRADMVQLLLDAGADPDVGREDSWPPLFSAASRGDLALLEPLLGAGADVEQSFEGFSAVEQAARCDMYTGRRGAITDRLLAAGARYTLKVAIALGELDAIPNRLAEATAPGVAELCVQRLRQERYHRPPRDRRAVWLETLRQLGEAGADLQPALRAAILSEDAELVLGVVRAGADPDAPVDRHASAAEMARFYRQSQIVQALEGR
jgi:hypothetical protein